MKRSLPVGVGLGLLLLGSLAAPAGRARAEDAAKPTVVLKGFDPVALCGGREAAGDPARTASHELMIVAARRSTKMDAANRITARCRRKSFRKR